jgi:YegS/Rv2252/BmrU family lipid kinase
MTSQAVLIYNPRAGAWRTARLVEKIRHSLAESGYETDPQATREPGHATRLARDAAASGVDVVFAHGGDGTLREAAAGLVGTDTALAPIPGGTANVVALALGFPNNPLSAAASLADAAAFSMDVGLCGEEIFLMQTSAGIDAHIMGRLDPALKRRFGKAAVAISSLSGISTYGYPAIELVADGRRAIASFIAVCNLAYYAGPYRMAPFADPRDRALDLVVFRGTGRLATIAFARDLFLGRHQRRRDVEMMRVSEVEIRGPRGLAVQLDGDTLPVQLPVTIGVHPRTIRMLKPSC